MAQIGTFGSGKLAELVKSWQEQDRQKREVNQSINVPFRVLALVLMVFGVGVIYAGFGFGIFMLLMGAFIGTLAILPAKPLPDSYLNKAHNFNWWVALGRNADEVLPVIEETFQMSEAEKHLPWERRIIVISLARGALASYQFGKWESELHWRVGTKALELASTDSALMVVKY
jgi:hypothetical protein